MDNDKNVDNGNYIIIDANNNNTLNKNDNTLLMSIIFTIAINILIALTVAYFYNSSNAIKTFFILFALEGLVALILYWFLNANFYQTIFFGGDILRLILELIIGLISAIK
jgi:hypothetical protein